MKVNVGVCRKIGLPNYSSLGASCNVEIDIETAVAGDPEDFMNQIRRVFGQCQRAVVEEIERQRAEMPADREPEPAHSNSYNDDRRPVERDREPEPARNGHSDSRSYGNGYREPRNGNTNGHGRERWGQPLRGEGRDRDRRDDRRDDRRNGNGRSGRGSAKEGSTPRSGKELRAWAKGLEEKEGYDGLCKAIERFGKDEGFPPLMINWTDRDVADAVAHAERWMYGGDN